LGIKQEVVTVPLKLKNFTSFKITKIACSGKKIFSKLCIIFKPIIIDESSGALTVSGDLFIWGRNKDNLLGLGENKKRVLEPVRVSILE
jgi:alpha-tubulin suppressor-like RCC1 family protein